MNGTKIQLHDSLNKSLMDIRAKLFEAIYNLLEENGGTMNIEPEDFIICSPDIALGSFEPRMVEIVGAKDTPNNIHVIMDNINEDSTEIANLGMLHTDDVCALLYWLEQAG
jgi:hypothetical protein